MNKDVIIIYRIFFYRLTPALLIGTDLLMEHIHYIIMASLNVIFCLKHTCILQTCRETLKTVNIADELAAECVCSILLLEDSTPRQVFNELLLLRTVSGHPRLLPLYASINVSSLSGHSTGCLYTMRIWLKLLWSKLFLMSSDIRNATNVT